MIRGLSSFIVLLAIAMGLGAWSAERVTRDFAGFGQIHVGGWYAQPNEGSGLADPYTRAYLARSGGFVLGAAEGLRFLRRTDDEGQSISSRCTYLLSGPVTDARGWTLSALSLDGSEPQTAKGLTNSHLTFYQSDGTIRLTLSPQLHPGHWASLPDGNQIEVTLTLYDTVVASNAGLTLPDLPSLTRVSCQ